MDKLVATVILVAVSVALLLGVWNWYLYSVVKPTVERSGYVSAVYIGRQSITGKMVFSLKITSTYRENITVTSIEVYNNTVLYVVFDGANSALPLSVPSGTHQLDIVVSTPVFTETSILINYTTPYGDTGYLLVRASD